MRNEFSSSVVGRLMPRCGNRIQNLWIDLLGFNSRLALKVEGLARVSKNAGGRPRLASVAFDGRYMGLAL